ncbi:MAG: hypothetical protein WD336_00985 [Trueperaceae bacterium]
MRRFLQGFVIGGLAVALLATTVVVAQQDDLRPRDWLLGAADDTERWSRIQGMFGGFAPAMREVRHYYEGAYESIADDNLELAQWNWGRIERSMQDGFMRRPGRQANGDAIFLDTAWVAVDEALEAGDRPAAQEAFLQARNACIACHVAEGRPYFNDQRLFWDTASFDD